jgi:LmbE family N-acetylglucosaminyl deacetylase
MDTTPLGTIVSIWAHPDDETYLAGGLMAAAAARGQRVVCVSATAGERGTDDPGRWPPLRLARVRTWEATAAMAVLGVTEHAFFGLPDGALGNHDADGRTLVDDLLDRVRPDTILTFGPDGMTFHPDHLVVHRWVTEAWETRGRPCRLLHAASSVEFDGRFRSSFENLGVYMTDDRPIPVEPDDLAVHLVLDGAALDRKVAALAAMATQTGALIERLGASSFADLVAEEAFVDAGRRC